MQLLTEVKERHADSLLAVPGVTGVGVGVIREDGMLTDELGIVVYVDPKFLQERSDFRDLIPSSIEGCRIDVRASLPQPV